MPFFSIRSAFRAFLVAFAVLVSVFTVFTARNVRAELVDRIAAVVNDEVILLSELNEATTVFEKRIRSMSYDDQREKEMIYKMRQDILDQMINQVLTDQQVKKFGIKVDPEEVDAALERLKQANLMTDEDLRAALKKEGQTMADYRKKIEEQILRTRLLNREVKSKIVITEDEIRKYYDSHKEKYAGQPTIHLKNIVMTYDAENKEAVEKKMEDVLEKIRGGSSFEEMAKKYSQFPNAEEGGELGEFEVQDLEPFIQKAVEGLQAGQATPVVDTGRELQIFYVAEKKVAGGKSLKEATGEIQDLLFRQVLDEKFNSWIGELRKRSHIKIIR